MRGEDAAARSDHRHHRRRTARPHDALSAKYMGFRIGVLDPTPDCPTAQVADFQVVGEYDDKTAIHDLAEKSDVLTYEFENVDAESIDEVRHLVAAPQGTDLLRVTQDRIHEKTFINRHGIETAPCVRSTPSRSLTPPSMTCITRACSRPAPADTTGTASMCCAMTATWRRFAPVATAAAASHRPSWRVRRFRVRASILVSGNGKDYVTFPIVRNDHRNNILHMTIAPAEVSPEIARTAHEMALALARGFELAGTLAIELFITKDGRVVVNELAPRPHNSGHYTIEACSIDQFDAHIRGIAGWPLIQPKLLSPAVMVNVLGQHVAPTRALIADHPEWNVHDYGKAQVRHNRKMGHITVLTDDTAATVEALEATGCWDDLK